VGEGRGGIMLGKTGGVVSSRSSRKRGEPAASIGNHYVGKKRREKGKRDHPNSVTRKERTARILQEGKAPSGQNGLLGM